MTEVVRGLLRGEDGYDLWLRYEPPRNPRRLVEYRRVLAKICVVGASSITRSIVDELHHALPSLLTVKSIISADDASERTHDGLLVATLKERPSLMALTGNLDDLGPEGYLIHRRTNESGAPQVLVVANGEAGLLYGVFALLRLLSRGVELEVLEERSAPKVKLRMVNHWDNLDGTIERGFAGHSLWDWYRLPGVVSPRIRDYARASASVGINGVALTNVNANALVLSTPYLVKVAAIANVFRAYGIRVFLTARFSAPMEIGGLPTSDPLNAAVQKWWGEKCAEIYRFIPDFGGFVVKANSEGQPGPQDYQRSHAEGANLLGRALKEHGGVVIWRAFVYSADTPRDRATQAYTEFVPLDGSFVDNAMVQVKNGPIDFQPREPHHALFGAMPKTPLLIEFQLTQEYLGNSTHLCYLAPLFSEVLQSQTHHSNDEREDTRVARVVDGSLHSYATTGMSAVINVGDDDNWCGHHFAAANWYAYGRLAWDPDADPRHLAREWLPQTFSQDASFVETALSIMMASREAVVNYMTPLGLCHIMAYDHHQGPGPWVVGGRPDWSSTYYHRADEEGVGFNRTSTGSDALQQYPEAYREQMQEMGTCPLHFLLWYHHVPWDRRLATGNTLWDELCLRYQHGVNTANQMQRDWESLSEKVDALRHSEVGARLREQCREALWWKDACLSYFQRFSKRPFPEDVKAPQQILEEYQAIEQYFVPGIPERRF
jgi:alpha-glucuronidase